MARAVQDLASKWANFQPGPTAKRIYACRKPIIAVEGPVGTGKSSIFCHYIAAHMAENPGAIWIVVRRTYRMLRDNTVRTWTEWFRDQQMGTWRPGDETFILDCTFFGRHARGEVLFRAAERPEDVDKFMGGEYAGYVLEEVTGTYQESGGLKEDIHTGLSMRLRQSGIGWGCMACRNVLPTNLIPTDPNTEFVDCPACGATQSVRARYHAILAFNPPSPGHWIEKTFPLPERETEDSAHFRINRSENAHNLPPGYYQRIARQFRLKGDWAARYLDGERVPIGKATCVFDTDQIYKALGDDKWTEPELARGVLERDPKTLKIRLKPDPNGPLRIWEAPKPIEEDRYVMGSDSGEGLEEGDPSCCYVKSRRTGKLVAEWYGHLVPRRFAKELAMLGWWYNNAFICPEVEPSAAGRSTCDAMENLGYSNLYLQRKEQHLGDPPVKRFGLPMTRTNKSRVIGLGRERVEDHEHRIPVRELLLEMLNFVRHPDGRMAGDIGMLDDRVMAWLCTEEAYEREGAFKPEAKVGKAPEWMAHLLAKYAGPGGGSQGWMGG